MVLKEIDNLQRNYPVCKENLEKTERAQELWDLLNLFFFFKKKQPTFYFKHPINIRPPALPLPLWTLLTQKWVYWKEVVSAEGSDGQESRHSSLKGTVLHLTSLTPRHRTFYFQSEGCVLHPSCQSRRNACGRIHVDSATFFSYMIYFEWDESLTTKHAIFKALGIIWSVWGWKVELYNLS